MPTNRGLARWGQNDHFSENPFANTNPMVGWRTGGRMKVGDIVGGEYQLVRPIGEGAMGAVWEALHERTWRRVALKLIIRPSEDLRARLFREARLCGSLRHENIVELYHAGETEKGDPFLVMELLTGETVGELLQRRHTLSPNVAARIGRDVAYALSAAHEARIMHRDLKPTNIFLHRTKAAAGYVVKVLDFGVAKEMDTQDNVLTRPGAAVGSMAYMSPEQLCVAKNLDARTDLWSLGVVLFEMIVGARPFRGPFEDLVHAILTEDAPRVSSRVRHVDPGLAEIIACCLTRDRQKRIGSALEVAAMLDVYTRGPSLPDDLAGAAPDSRHGAMPGRTERASPVGPIDSGEILTQFIPPKERPRQVTVNGTLVIGPAEAAGLRQLCAEAPPEQARPMATPLSIAALPELPPVTPWPATTGGRGDPHGGTTSTDGLVRGVSSGRPESIPECMPPLASIPPAPAERGRRPVVGIRVASGMLAGALCILGFAVIRDKASTERVESPGAALSPPVAPSNAEKVKEPSVPPKNAVRAAEASSGPLNQEKKNEAPQSTPGPAKTPTPPTTPAVPRTKPPKPATTASPKFSPRPATTSTPTARPGGNGTTGKKPRKLPTSPF